METLNETAERRISAEEAQALLNPWAKAGESMDFGTICDHLYAHFRPGQLVMGPGEVPTHVAPDGSYHTINPSAADEITLAEGKESTVLKLERRIGVNVSIIVAWFCSGLPPIQHHRVGGPIRDA